MNCATVQRDLSAQIDGYPLAPELQKHVEGCPHCQAFQAELEALAASSSHLTREPAPDLVPAILRSLPSRRQRQLWLAPAAGLAAGLIVGLIVAGGPSGPDISAALADRVVAGQDRVEALSGVFRIEELIARGTSRSYEGAIFFVSPEYVSLEITEVGAPAGWSENSVRYIVDASESLTIEPFPCPELGGCEAGTPRISGMTGRDPFSAVSPAPLDAVVPVSVLKGSVEPNGLPARSVAGFETTGFEVTAAQARPLLDAYFGSGNFRAIHDTDLVSVWLEGENLVPLLLTVEASSSAERDSWAAVRGYVDGPDPYLTLEFTELRFTSIPRREVAFPDAATVRDAGYREVALAPPIDLDMELVSAGRTVGLVSSEVWAWSDGRSWLRLDQTGDWSGPGLFGNPGLPVEEVTASGGPIYLAGNDSAVFIHSDNYDAVITGSVSVDDLIVAASLLDGPFEAVPADWPEAPISPDSIQGAFLPFGLEGFEPPIMSSFKGVLIIDLFGGGNRSARITQRPGDSISPPLDPDARAANVRGLIARYSPMFGVLEWVEDGTILTVEGKTLSLAEILTIAQSLTAQSLTS